MRKSIRAIGKALDWFGRVQGLVVLAYHRIDDGGGGLAVSPSSFAEHLDWIEASGIPVVGSLDPPYPGRRGAPQIAFTFDDGYRSVADVAWPMLRARGWPATLFVVAKALDDPRPFTWDAGVDDGRAKLIDRRILDDLAADGMTIGSHTCTHRYLPSVPVAEIRTEVVDSRHLLEDAIGREVVSLSYPMGGWNPTIRTLCAAAGYATGVTSDRGCNTAGADPLALRRQPAPSDPLIFARTLRGAFDFLRPIDRARRAKNSHDAHVGASRRMETR